MNQTTTNVVKRSAGAPEKIQQRAFAAPAVDIYENADELLLVADLPGVDKDELTIHFEKGQLTIEGRRKAGAEGAARAIEFRALDFRRTFSVPQGINAERIAADLAAGVLRVHLPKADALKPRQIPVKAS